MRSLSFIRATLALVALVDLLVAYAFLFAPSWIMRFYVLQELDDVHLFLAMGLGSLMLVFAVGALLAFVHPRRHKSMIVLIILSNFFPFLIDVVVLARGQMDIRQVLPEMLYFLVVTVLLVRFFPGKLAEITEPTEPEVEPIVAPVLDIAEESDTII